MLLKKSEDRILFLLKNHGQQTAQQLASKLEITPMGARQHLLALQKKGLVSSHQKKSGVGRPKQYWEITNKAENRFPDSHAQLAVDLLNSIENTFGLRGLKKLIDHREQLTLDTYKKQLDQYALLKSKLKKLAEMRTQEGYMAEYQRCEDGSYLLIENHCPICSAATRCQQFCLSELQLFKALVKSDQVTVKRESHLIQGDKRCVYRFTLKVKR